MKELNEHLAVKVMGWETTTLGGCDYWYIKPDGVYLNKPLPKFNWQPHENIQQAMMVLGAFEVWCIEHYWEGYEVSITDSEAIQYKSENESLPLAICLAAAKATGWQE